VLPLEGPSPPPAAAAAALASARAFAKIVSSRRWTLGQSGRWSGKLTGRVRFLLVASVGRFRLM
jgi:hypothetical protein